MMKGRGYVILVDKNDRKIGVEEKMSAHAMKTGRLHRALSVFVFNSKGETMLQQRTTGKYHSKGKWSNTCCSHPMPGEKVITAAHRRLGEEMGFDCEMWEAFEFPYEANVGNGLREREYDHIIFGKYEKEPEPNKREVQNWKWMKMEELVRRIKKNPNAFTPWVRLMIDEVERNYVRMHGRINKA
jgi:isopentenyl-diphosphate delta-isomerase